MNEKYHSIWKCNLHGEFKTFKGIKSKQEAINKIEALTKAISEYKKLPQSQEVKRQIEQWNWTIDECKHAIVFFERKEKMREKKKEMGQ